MDLCLLHIDHHRIALPMAAVREVLIRPRLTALPLAPAALAGITSFRGQCLPVFELTRIPGFSDQPPTVTSRDRVVVCQDPEACFGLRVDLVNRVATDVAAPPSSETDDTLLAPLPGADDSAMRFLFTNRLVRVLQTLAQKRPTLTPRP